ncbi:MAG: maltose alpha-D-glucosyltransferase [Chloroflexi bacterium]|nr:maltose alpha-D-glucosyltransferase [Chloroflexota bacterium]
MTISKDNSASDPLWFKDAILYEIRIRSFSDSNGDGIGDFRGATEKLDYLQDLGVNVLWLLPFYPSPGRDDGYDISDYMSVHPDVGTLQDFKVFLREAHKRGLKVMTELVVNHTSDQHPWFQEARRALPNSPARKFYVWSDRPDRYQEARIIFKDFETSNWAWDPIAKAYYWHRFYDHQPDLNYDNPHVQQAVIKVMDFWLKLGVDGLRLDAVPYLYEREGTNCENLPETHAFLRKLRAHVDANYENRVLLAEANQWPEDAVTYFGDGDECHMAFHFPIMPRLFMAARMEERFPIIDILNQTPDIPENSQWAMFLRNHDELTLEMVTEEERDYMYRVYANDAQARINLGIRRRLATLLGNDRKRIELMNALLFSLPGTPVMYYGDEIGMGDNFYLGDRNGVRTPMQWNADRNAGFSRANAQRLFLPVIVDPQYHYETVNVETQQQNPHSLLWWTKRLIALRKRYAAFGRGTMQMLEPENSRVLAFVRCYEDETILFVCNLSRFVQHTELDLSEFSDRTPVELFSSNPFPQIEERPYFFTLGPHGFYWFALQPAQEPATGLEAPTLEPAQLKVNGTWANILKKSDRKTFETILSGYVRERRWFQSKAKTFRTLRIDDILPISGADAYLLLLKVSYQGNDDEMYMLPLGFAPDDQADQMRYKQPSAVICDLLVQNNDQQTSGILFDAISDPKTCEMLLNIINRQHHLKGEKGSLIARATRKLKEVWDTESVGQATVLGYEQSNTSIRFGERMIFKLVRKVAEGVNPELEIGRFLVGTEVSVPPLLGSLEYKSSEGEPMTLGVLQGYMVNQGDAWRYTLGWLGRYLEHALMHSQDSDQVMPDLPNTSLIRLAQEELPEQVQQVIGDYLEDAKILGQRTAEMHVALASGASNEAFKPEPFSKLYQRSLYQSMRNLNNGVFSQLRSQQHTAAKPLTELIEQTLALEPLILEAFMSVSETKLSGMRTRVHSDFHLGQVLRCGSDFMIIDFEGEPARSLSERRLKRSPLSDVAGMLRSFHYAAYSALPGYGVQSFCREEDFAALEPWARFWQIWTSVAFLKSYMETAAPANLLPHSIDELELLLRLFTLEKAVYEIGYELNNRPGWLKVPIQAVIQQFEEVQV